jgi:hypothetical protein
MLSGMAYESMTKTGRPRLAPGPQPLKTMCEGKGLPPVPCPIHPTAWKVNTRQYSKLAALSLMRLPLRTLTLAM